MNEYVFGHVQKAITTCVKVDLIHFIHNYKIDWGAKIAKNKQNVVLSKVHVCNFPLIIRIKVFL